MLISKEVADAFFNLQTSYDTLLRIRKIGLPKQLKSALDARAHSLLPETYLASTWLVCRAFLFMQSKAYKRWLFLREFAETDFINVCRQSGRLLTGESAFVNFQRVVQYKDFSLIQQLAEKGLLLEDDAEANLQMFTEYKGYGPEGLIGILELLKDKGLLTGEFAESNREKVLIYIKHKSAMGLLLALEALQKADLWGDSQASFYFQLVVTCFNPQETDPLAPDGLTIANYLVKMQEKGLLAKTGARANAKLVWRVIKDQDFRKGEIIEQIALMSAENLLDENDSEAQFFRDALEKDQGDAPRNIGEIFVWLHKKELLKGDENKANREAIVAHKNYNSLASILINLKDAGLLLGTIGGANRVAAVKYENSDIVTLNYAVSRLLSANLLNQTNFDALIAFSMILLKVAEDYWFRIEPKKLTQEHLENIFQICRENNSDSKTGRLHFINYVNQHLAHPSGLKESSFAGSSYSTFLAGSKVGPKGPVSYEIGGLVR